MIRAQQIPLLREATIFALYQHGATTGGGITADKITTMLGSVVGSTFVARALDQLERDRLVDGHHSIIDPSNYEISEKGINYVQDQLTNPDSNVSQFNNHGTDWLRVDPNNPPNPNSTPSSNIEAQITFTEFRDALLLALVVNEEESVSSILDPKEVADQSGLFYRRGWINKASHWFEDQGMADVSQSIGGDVDEHLRVRLLANALEYAEEIRPKLEESNLFRQPPVVGNSERSAPASDRFVSRTDNEDAWDHAVESLDRIIEEADKTNDFGDLTDTEIEYVKNTLRSGRRLFDEGKVRIAALSSVLLPLLNWLSEHKDQIAIGALSSVAAAAISALFGIS